MTFMCPKCNRAVRQTSDPRFVTCPKCGPVYLTSTRTEPHARKAPATSPTAPLTGEERREEGLGRVEGPAFTEAVREVVGEVFVPGELVTADDIRFRCEEREVVPHHSNAWGAAVMALVRGGVLEKTGSYTKSSRPSNHAHHYPEYVVRTSPGRR